MKRKPLSDEHKAKISVALRGKPKPPRTVEHCAKHNAAMRGKHHTAEARAKQSAATKQQWQDLERRARTSEASKQRWQDPEYHARTSEAMRGKPKSAEHRQKLSESRRGKLSGEQHPNWQGGLSFELYPQDWTRTLRRSIRERDHYTCRLCAETQGDVAFAVHHVDYDKKNCDPTNLITLCGSCHSKTNTNREHWTPFFRAMMTSISLSNPQTTKEET